MVSILKVLTVSKGIGTGPAFGHTTLQEEMVAICKFLGNDRCCDTSTVTACLVSDTYDFTSFNRRATTPTSSNFTFPKMKLREEAGYIKRSFQRSWLDWLHYVEAEDAAFHFL